MAAREFMFGFKNALIKVNPILNGTPLRSGRVTHENLYFLVTNRSSVSKLTLWYMYMHMSFIDSV